MKTDRKLLELAALAAGLVYEHPGFAYPTRFKERVATWHPVTSGCDQFEHIPLTVWNPLADDSDALRLAVKLMMSVEISDPEDSTYAYAGEAPRVYACEMWRDDKYAATRRAIVCAAAEIGKAMLAVNTGSNTLKKEGT